MSDKMQTESSDVIDPTIEIESDDNFESFVSGLIESKVGMLEEPDKQEHIVDIENDQIKEALRQSREIFDKFIAQHADRLDLGLPGAERDQAIAEVVRAAKNERIFDKAKKINELIYDHNESYYGVCYISDECMGGCSYCPHSDPSNKKQVLLKDKKHILDQLNTNPQNEELREKLKITDQSIDNLHLKNYIVQMQYTDEGADTMAEQPMGVSPLLKRDLEALAEEGHTELCILAGDYGFNDLSLVIDAAVMAATVPNINRLVINMGVYKEGEYKKLVDAVKVVNPELIVQFRIFQETYIQESYSERHRQPDIDPETKEQRRDEKGELKWIPTKKGSFSDRRGAQAQALAGGFDEAGTGVLIGLSNLPLVEIAGLVEHIRGVNEAFGDQGKSIVRSAIPIANKPDGAKVEIPFHLYEIAKHDDLIELVYALHRLGTPDVTVVHSERDREDLRLRLKRYTNHTTLNVHPEPGGNIRSLLEESIDDMEQSSQNQRISEIYSKLLISEDSGADASVSLSRVLEGDISGLEGIKQLIGKTREQIKNIHFPEKEQLQTLLFMSRGGMDEVGYANGNRLLNIADQLSEPQRTDTYKQLAAELPQLVDELMTNVTIPKIFTDSLANTNLVEISNKLATLSSQISGAIEKSIDNSHGNETLTKLKSVLTEPMEETLSQKISDALGVLLIEKETAKDVREFLKRWDISFDETTQELVNRNSFILGGHTHNMDDVDPSEVRAAIKNGGQDITQIVEELRKPIGELLGKNRQAFTKSLEELWLGIEGTEAVGQAKVHPDKPKEKLATNIILGINGLNFRRTSV